MYDASDWTAAAAASTSPGVHRIITSGNMSMGMPPVKQTACPAASSTWKPIT